MTEVVRCDYCDGDRQTELYVAYRGQYSSRIVRCDTCGLVFTNPRLSETELYDFYQSDAYFFAEDSNSVEPFNATIRLGHPYHRLREDNEESHLRLRWLDRYAPHKGRLLEVGCATGFNLAAARSRGWATLGVEPSACAASFARIHFGLDVRTGLIESALVPGERFDAIVAYHVLEHVLSPKKFLEQLRYHMRDRGLLALEVPDFSSPSSRRMRAAWVGLAPPEHLYHFEPKTLLRYLEKTGFGLLEMRRKSGGGTVVGPAPGDVGLRRATGRLQSFLFLARRLFYWSPPLRRLIRHIYFHVLAQGDAIHVIARAERSRHVAS